MNEYENKVILITGAGSGIGRATALLFAHHRSQVIVSDRDEVSGFETVNKIKEMGGKASFFKCDISNEKEVQELITKTIKEFGQLDFAFNNAGIEGIPAPTNECTLENWNKTISVNLTGLWLCMKYELQEMLKYKRGKIVNCSSIAGLVGFENIPAYVASKHGIIGLTKTAAIENAKNGIRINAICPGTIQTPMLSRFTKGDEQSMAKDVPMGRIGKPEEIAEAVLWLCSDKSSYMTGQAMAVDGGWTCH
jgi:NAD(P)-dependent dehydrogenase (short-subunit alcohol dehydrogenase family)